MFFFEKKNQKTFVTFSQYYGNISSELQVTKVFLGDFFSKKSLLDFMKSN